MERKFGQGAKEQLICFSGVQKDYDKLIVLSDVATHVRFILKLNNRKLRCH